MNKRIHAKLMSIYHALFEAFGLQHWWPGETRTEIMIGAILTQNTNWGNVERAIANLKREKMLNFKVLHKAGRATIARLIQPSGYFNVKAKRLKHFIDFLYADYNGSVRKLGVEPLSTLRAKVLSVNGVGPETADSILLYALDKPVFVVDAYTKRIFSRLGLIVADEDYHAVQKLFMDNLPADVSLFNEYHALIVRLAKEHCRTKPQCDGCPLVGLKCKAGCRNR